MPYIFKAVSGMFALDGHFIIAKTLNPQTLGAYIKTLT